MANNNFMKVGVRFSPTDEELLEIFLPQRGNLSPIYPINHVDVYGENEPWRIFDKQVKQIHYVYVKLKRKTKNGTMIKRTAGCGTWSGQTAGKPISVDQGLVLGYKKLLTFETPNGDIGDNGRWIMHEYSMAEDDSDYVLCAIRNKELDVDPVVNAPKKRVLRRGKNRKNALNIVELDLTNEGAIPEAKEIGNQQEAAGGIEGEILNQNKDEFSGADQNMKSNGGVTYGYSFPQEVSNLMPSIMTRTSEDIDYTRYSDDIHVQGSIGAVTLQAGENCVSNENEDVNGMWDFTSHWEFDNFVDGSLLPSDIGIQDNTPISNTTWFEKQDNFQPIDEVHGFYNTSSNQHL